LTHSDIALAGKDMMEIFNTTAGRWLEFSPPANVIQNVKPIRLNTDIFFWLAEKTPANGHNLI
jgi:hypothetical protein